MSTLDERVLDTLRFLLRSSHLGGVDDLPALVRGAGQRLGAHDATLYVVDYDQTLLVPLTESGAPPSDPGTPEPVTIDGTLAGRAFSDVTQHVGSAGELVSFWAPVIDGTDRLGVLQLLFAPDTVVDHDLRQACTDLASLVAELLMSKRMYGDAVELARRRSTMSVPAEMQWTLLPPLTFVSPRVAISGVLAPAVEVAGDSFDYALNGDTAHVALFDAMGHGMEATLLAGVAVSSLRNARRSGRDLADTARTVERELEAQFGPDRFVTGIIGELDLATGWWTWTTCGHPPALLVRGGHVVKVLGDVVGPPLGLGLLDDPPQIGRERLQPGDRLLLYSDGVIEARDADGEFFGTDRLVDFVTRQAVAGRPVAETLRRLNHAVLDHQEGTLQDDATTVLVEWLVPGEPQESSPEPDESPVGP
ncbi:MAG: Serine/threonine-protein phosphatase [Frankiales bacterium]|nr:Serine/threonine-protein phosphatase [Frankiales bacterium]